MHIALLGLTGSGKTTTAKALSARTDLPRVSSGHIARQLASDDPSTRLTLERGDYAPESAMRTLVRQQLEAADAEHGGWILEGFPRTVAQLVCLMQWLTAEPLWVLVDTDPHECLRRLLGRSRHDDIADAIAHKLDAYRTDTQPVIDVLDSDGALIRVPGGASTKDQVEVIRSKLP